MRNILSTFLRTLLRSCYSASDKLIAFQWASLVTAGSNSRFYRKSSVINLQNDSSQIVVGNNTHVRGELLIFPYGGRIKIGSGSYVGEGSRIWSGESVIIGNHVGIAHNVTIADCAHETNHLERAAGFLKIFSNGHPKTKGNIPTAPIQIDDHVAIYPNSVISRGVRIGEGSIISAGSVVLNDVKPFTLMLGNPARPMGSLH